LIGFIGLVSPSINVLQLRAPFSSSLLAFFDAPLQVIKGLLAPVIRALLITTTTTTTTTTTMAKLLKFILSVVLVQALSEWEQDAVIFRSLPIYPSHPSHLSP
jgi:hypothetical protein